MTVKKLTAKRAHRIEVDRCGRCPFFRGHQGDAKCLHPRSRYIHFSLIRADTLNPPAWCPLRGSVTMIAGPRSGVD